MTTMQNGTSDMSDQRLAALSALLRRVCLTSDIHHRRNRSSTTESSSECHLVRRYAQHLCFDAMSNAQRSVRTPLVSELDWLVVLTASPSICSATFLLAQDSRSAARTTTAAAQKLTFCEELPVATFVCSGLNAELVNQRPPGWEIGAVPLTNAFKWLLQSGSDPHSLSVTDLFFRSPWSRKIQRARLPSCVPRPVSESVRKEMRDELLSLYRAQTRSSGWDAASPTESTTTVVGGGGAPQQRIHTAVREFLSRLEGTLNTAAAAYANAYTVHLALSLPEAKCTALISTAGCAHVREVSRSRGIVKSRSDQTTGSMPLSRGRADGEGAASLAVEIVLFVSSVENEERRGDQNGGTDASASGMSSHSSLFDAEPFREEDAEDSVRDPFGVRRVRMRNYRSTDANRAHLPTRCNSPEPLATWSCQHTFLVTIAPATAHATLSTNPKPTDLPTCSANLRHQAAHFFRASPTLGHPHSLRKSCQFSHEEKRNPETVQVNQLGGRQRADLLLQLCGGNEHLLDTDEGLQFGQFADILSTDDCHLAELIGQRMEAVDNSFVSAYVPRVMRQTLPHAGPDALCS